MANQKPLFKAEMSCGHCLSIGPIPDADFDEVADGIIQLYEHPVPSPAAHLAELVPGNDLLRVLDFAKFVIKCVRKNGEYAPLSSQEPNEIDAILRNIEELKCLKK